MQPIGDVTQAPAPVTFHGNEYRATPLSDKDLVELDHWIQAQFIARVRESLESLDPDNKPEDQIVYEREMQGARRQALTITWMSGEGAGMMATVNGTARVLWHQLRKNHPEMTHDDCRELMIDPQSIGLAQQLFKTLDLNPTARQADKMEQAALRSATLKKQRADKQKAKNRKRRKRSRKS